MFQITIEDIAIFAGADFLTRHPGIVDVAGFLHSCARTHYKFTGKYKAFDRLGVDNVEDYLSLVANNHAEAVKLYEKTRDILSF